MTTLRDLQYVIEANTSGLSKAFPAIDKLNSTVERLDKTVRALNANTAKSSQQAGQAFQRQANTVGRAAKQMQGSLKKQEAAIISANSRMKDLNKAIKDVGAPSRLLANNTRAFNVLQKTLKDTKTTTEQAAIAKAKFNSSLATTRRALKDYTAQQKAAQAAQKAQDAALIKQRNAVEAVRIKYEDLKKSLVLQKAHKGRIDELTSSFRRFEGQMKGGVLSADAYSKSLTRINGTMGKVRRNAGMTDFSARMTDFAKSAQIALGPLSGVASRITAITSLANRSTIAVAGLVGGMIAFGVVMAKSVLAGAQYEKQMFRIDTILKVTNNRIGMTATEVDMVAKSVGDMTMTTQSMARNAAAAFLTLRGMTKDLLEDSLLAAQGLSLIGRGDIESNSRRLMRILEDPAANLKALTEAGVYFNKVEEERIKLLQESGRTDEARRAVMDRLQPVIKAAQGETAGLAGAWDSFQEQVTSFMQDSAVSGGSVSILTSIVKDLTGWLKNMNTNTNASIVIGTAYRVVASGLSTTMRILMHVLDGVGQGIRTVTEAWDSFTKTRAYQVLQALDRGAQAVVETWWELPGVMDLFIDRSGKAEDAADKMGNSVWDVADRVGKLQKSLARSGVGKIELLPDGSVSEASKKLAAYQSRFDEAMLRLNERINDSIVSGNAPDVDMSVVQDAINKVESGRIEEAAVSLERYLKISRDSVSEINKANKARDDAANSWVDLKQQHLGFITEMQTMEAQLTRLSSQWDDMAAVLIDTGMSAEQAQAHLNRLRKEIELNGSSLNKFLNQQEQAIEIQKQEARIAAATGAERARMSQELKVVQALWQSGIVTASNYTEALQELRTMGYGALADEIARTTRELDNWSRAADVAAMERGLIDNVKLMERELALAGKSEAERAIGMDVAAHKQAMLNAGIEEGSIEWQKQIALVKQLAEMDIQKGHVEAVKSLQDQMVLQEANVRSLFYSEKTRNNIVALAEKELELANKYGSLSDARAQKELKLFQIMQQRQNMIDDWEEVGKIMEKAFQGAEDALVDFIKTGELNIQKLLSSISEDVFRMTFRMLVMDPLKDTLGKFMSNLPGQGIPGDGIMPGLKDVLGASPATAMWVRNVDGGLSDLLNPQAGKDSILPGGTPTVSPMTTNALSGADRAGVGNFIPAGKARDAMFNPNLYNKPAEALTKSAEKLNDSVIDLGNGIDMTTDAFDYKMDLMTKEAQRMGETVNKSLVDLGGGIEMTENAFSRKMELMQQEAARMGDTLTKSVSKGLEKVSVPLELPKPTSSTDWLNQIYAKARAGGMNDVQARLHASQAALESGWGKSAPGNNMFGIKAGKSWKGEVQHLKTWEEIGGKRVSMVEPFRKYGSLEEGLLDRNKFMESRFPDAFGANTWDEAKQGLMNGKYGAYATDSKYLGKLDRINSRIDPNAYASAYTNQGMPGMGGGNPMMANNFTGGGGSFTQGSLPGMGGGGGFEQLSQSAQQASTNLQNMSGQVPQLTSSFQEVGNQANTLASSGLQPATQSFQQMSQQGLQNAMTQQITTTAQTQQMGLQSTVTGAQVQQLGMAATQAAAQMQMQGAASGVAGIFHGGGVVGQGGGMRATNLGGFKGTTPRLHGGLHPNEFRAILERGETVFTEDQTEALGRAIGAGAGGGERQTSSGPRGGIGSVNVNLYGIKDFDTFRKSKSQLDAGMQSATQQAMMRQG